MTIYEFRPSGVCAQIMAVEIVDDTLKDIQILGGCSGNSQGVMSLSRGMKVQDIIDRLEGIKCGNKSTSCPDQLARGLREALKQEADRKLKE